VAISSKPRYRARRDLLSSGGRREAIAAPMGVAQVLEACGRGEEDHHVPRPIGEGED
jgi:hypothetical protein